MYNIDPNYNHRKEVVYFDDTANEDEWQKEVYLYAKDLAIKNNYKNIVDFGCGSGYKLIHNFNDYNTIGIDLEPTIKFLNEKYPGKTWVTTQTPLPDIDIFIASDVIEHMEDPDVLINYIKQCKPKEIILSTPDRNLTIRNWGYPKDGPPDNKHHIREWTYNEFYDYISSEFEIVCHKITNEQQCTQMIHARIK